MSRGLYHALFRGSVWKMGDDGGALSLPPGITDARASWNRGFQVGWKAPLADYAIVMISQTAADGAGGVFVDVFADEGWLCANGTRTGGAIAAPDLSILPGWERVRLDPSNAAGTSWTLALDTFDDRADISYEAQWASEPAALPAAARTAERVRAAHEAAAQ